MKTALYLPIALMSCFATSGCLKAASVAADPEESAYAQDDADGVPLVVRQSQTQHLSPEEMAALHKEQEHAAQDKDWLLRGYEQQLQANPNAGGPQDRQSNLYYELSSDKELAKLAGLPTLDLGNDASSNPAPSRTAPSPSDHAPTGRSDSPTTASSPSQAQSYDYLFKPVISLAPPAAASLHGYYASLALPHAGLPVSKSQAKTAPSADSSDLETPGLVAAEKDPLTDPSDLSLEMLPGETREEAEARQENNNAPELALPMDADQLHDAQAAALSIDGSPVSPHSSTAPAQASTPASAPTKTILLEDPDTPLPVTKVPPINPVRSPIANPYDILNR